MIRLYIEHNEGARLLRWGGHFKDCRSKSILINGVVVDRFDEGLPSSGHSEGRAFDRLVEDRMRLYEKALGVERVDIIMEILMGPDEEKTVEQE